LSNEPEITLYNIQGDKEPVGNVSNIHISSGAEADIKFDNVKLDRPPPVGTLYNIQSSSGAWSTACPDWENRILAGTSLVPTLPLFNEEAERAVRVFSRLRLPDVSGSPPLSVALPWLLPIVAAIFGAYDPKTRRRMLQELFLLVPKKNGKSTGGAAIMLTALILNRRPQAECVLVAPTKEIADVSFSQASGMIRLDPELATRFHATRHQRTITDQRSELAGAKLLIRAADVDVLTGGKQSYCLIDETHVFATRPNASDLFVELRGALAARPDGLLMQISTQSKTPPAGVFRAELRRARAVRDGELALPILPILYELPERLSSEWRDPQYWRAVNPNLGRSVDEGFLEREVRTAETEGARQLALIASQHFNVEIGLAQRTDRWTGAEYWPRRTDPTLTRQELLRRSETVVVGIDGGGLDDLLGFNLLGRDTETKEWLSWSYGFCHRGVLDRRKSIASRLEDFERAGELTIVEDDPLVDQLYEALAEEDEDRVKRLRENIKDRGFPADIAMLVGFIREVQAAGLLAEVAVDPAGLGLIVDALAEIGVTDETGLIGVKQGIALMNAMKTAERRLQNGSLWHCPSALMSWCVSNVKIEPTATAIRATKQNAGDAKIDLWAAMINAVDRMALNPETKRSVYERRGLLVLGGARAAPSPARPPVNTNLPDRAMPQPPSRPMITVR
jgi:phage terminase large subunit-like protein